MALITKSVALRGGVSLSYCEQGESSGVPVILLHGYADSWHSFEPVLAHLPPSIHAFAVTQRGHGDSSRPENGYQVHDFATDLREFMDALHVQAAFVVGGSSGGFIARRIAIDYPRRTLGLVLLGSPATLRDKPGVRAIWDSTIVGLTDPIDHNFVREFQAGTLVASIPQDFFERLVHESLKVPARVWTATFEGLLQDNAVDELNNVAAPTLIIWGDQDAVLPRSDQEALASAIPNARLLVYSGAGHAIYWEEPGRIASDLTAFIRSLGYPV